MRLSTTPSYDAWKEYTPCESAASDNRPPATTPWRSLEGEGGGGGWRGESLPLLSGAAFGGRFLRDRVGPSKHGMR